MCPRRCCAHALDDVDAWRRDVERNVALGELARADLARFEAEAESGFAAGLAAAASRMRKLMRAAAPPRRRLFSPSRSPRRRLCLALVSQDYPPGQNGGIARNVAGTRRRMGRASAITRMCSPAPAASRASISRPASGSIASRSPSAERRPTWSRRIRSRRDLGLFAHHVRRGRRARRASARRLRLRAAVGLRAGRIPRRAALSAGRRAADDDGFLARFAAAATAGPRLDGRPRRTAARARTLGPRAARPCCTPTAAPSSRTFRAATRCASTPTASCSPRTACPIGPAARRAGGRRALPVRRPAGDRARGSTPSLAAAPEALRRFPNCAARHRRRRRHRRRQIPGRVRGPRRRRRHRRAGDVSRPRGRGRVAGVLPRLRRCCWRRRATNSFGLVYLEGMMFGKPVIGGRGGGGPEVIGDAGLLVAAGDVAGLAEAMMRFAAEPELRRAMGGGGPTPLRGQLHRRSGGAGAARRRSGKTAPRGGQPNTSLMTATCAAFSAAMPSKPSARAASAAARRPSRSPASGRARQSPTRLPRAPRSASGRAPVAAAPHRGGSCASRARRRAARR